MKKNFLITGASSGLGEEFVLSIADIAAGIVIISFDNKKLSQIQKKIKQINPDIKILKVVSDLSSENGVDRLINIFKKQQKIKYIDVVINSAANFLIKKIEDVNKKDLKKDFQLNVISPFLISQYFGSIMKKRKKGFIFNIGSSSSYDCSKDTSVYCATKHALLGMSKSFEVEWRPHGVKSILVAPGSMKTPMGRKVKNQDFETFIEPKEVVKLMKNLIENPNLSMSIEEIKLKRILYK